jgi:two-component system sensor histidine kinase BaeS
MRSPRWRLRSRVLLTHLGVAASTVLGGVIAALVFSPEVTSAPGSSSRNMLLFAACIFAAALTAGTVAAALLSRWLFTKFVRPLRRLTTVARRLSKGTQRERAFKPVAESAAPDDEDTAALAVALHDLASSLEAAEQRRTLLFGEVTHEIRTPVAVLEGYLEGLLDGHVQPTPQTWAMLYDEASRVHRMVDELQELSRAESRQSQPDLQAVDPALIANAALERLRLHFDEKGLAVSTHIGSNLPRVYADPDQALQALVNLLTNALRYTQVPGQVRLTVGLLADSSEVVFKVTDTGVGIAAEHIPHLFERFFRVDRAGSRKSGGSGIGLPVAKALVDAMGGRIWAESPGLGKGSTFSFTLLVASPPPIS